MCKELKLIVEVDGYWHNFKTEADEKRDKDLREMGFTVLRFSDKEVMQDLNNVQRTLEIWIEENGGVWSAIVVIPLPPSKGDFFPAKSYRFLRPENLPISNF